MRREVVGMEKSSYLSTRERKIEKRYISQDIIGSNVTNTDCAGYSRSQLWSIFGV